METPEPGLEESQFRAPDGQRQFRPEVQEPSEGLVAQRELANRIMNFPVMEGESGEGFRRRLVEALKNEIR
jgi:hypothetical protein